MTKKQPLKGNKTKISKNEQVIPRFLNNVITANKTDSEGRIRNISPENAVLARNEVNDNHK